MPQRFNWLRILATLWLLPPSLYAAETFTFQQNLNGYTGTDDNTIYADRTENTNGSHHLIYAGNNISDPRRGLIRFDLNAGNQIIPPGSLILSVQLQLILQYSGLDAADSDIYSIHLLQKAWGEGTVDSGDPGGLGAPANPGDATWTDNRFMDSKWTTAGGDFLTTPSAEIPIARWNSIDNSKNTYNFASPEMARDAQFWIDNPGSNFGWILIGEENGSRNSRRFYSSEAPPPSSPKLTITFQPPLNSATIVKYLLGVFTDPTGLDVNGDGVIDIADVIAASQN